MSDNEKEKGISVDAATSITVNKQELEESLAKTFENWEKNRKKFNLSQNKTDELSLKSAEVKLNEVKFINAVYNGDKGKINEMVSDRAKALRESSDAAGGYLVPTTFEARVFEAFDDFSEIVSNADIVPMTSKTQKLNELVAKVQVYKTAELGQATASQPTFGEPVLTTEKYMGSTTMSEELIEDSEVDIITSLSRQYAEQLAYKLQDSLVNSVVSGSEGILVVSGVSSVALITTGSYANTNWDDLAAMQVKLFKSWNKSEVKTAKYYMSMDTYQTIRTRKAAGDGNYFLMPQVPTKDMPAMAWGSPIVVLNEFPSPTVTSSKFVVYSDLSKHLVVGRRRPLRIKVNTQGTSADGTNLNTQDARELVMTARFAQVTVNEAGIVVLATS